MAPPRPLRTVVLDDDPTGTQSASDVEVLFSWEPDTVLQALTDRPSVYVLTNTRSVGEADAVRIVDEIRSSVHAAAERLDLDVRFVLRGDSTLRGHVFAETDRFMTDSSVVVFVPAFPEGGRTTVDGMHYVQTADGRVPADQTEYAQDPVFGFASSYLPTYVREKSGRHAVMVASDTLRGGGLSQIIVDAPAGTVILPDVSDADDVRLVAAAITTAEEQGRDVVTRCASPLAAALAGVESGRLLATPLVPKRRPTLLICGSHTNGATRQLAAVADVVGAPDVISTDAALENSSDAAEQVVEQARRRLASTGVAVVASERVRDLSHNTLEHGQQIMDAIIAITRGLVDSVDVIVSKGGITSAEVARAGVGAQRAVVLGQVVPGVSVWSLVTERGHHLHYVVVPGNVGGDQTLVDVLAAVDIT